MYSDDPVVVAEEWDCRLAYICILELTLESTTLLLEYGLAFEY